MTSSRLRYQSATNTRAPSADASMPTGPLPAGSVSITRCVRMSITDRVLLSGLET